ncbi:type II toxin-antitoxin system RelE/ParE family toxin [Brevundimonas sp.]|uniref:type II toxin-antitoxin system RelE/ParE family toxin n=1 Tax=Brevundimonas sp. TaxID=1871086 RepID=UPI003784F5E2
MTLPVRFSRASQADRERLAAFLARNSPQAAEDAADAITTAIARLGAFPMLGRSVASGDRELSVKFGKAGYIVRYRIDPDAVVVARIFHMLEHR